jgi:hypothetical protein
MTTTEKIRELLDLEKYKVDDRNAQVRFIDDDVAIIAYKVNERVAVDGKALDIGANDASVWLKHDGEWVCAMHTESLAGDPYGRDRTTSAGRESTTPAS